MNRKKIIKTIALTLSLSSLLALAPNDFVTKANADEWVKTNGIWFLKDNQGNLKTGWVNDNGTWYYLNADGSMVFSKWIKSSGKWYYLGSTGAMVTNNTVDNCEIGPDGAWITNVGIDTELTEQLRNIFIYHTSSYKGVMVSDFNDILFKVADGNLSEQEAVAKINKMKSTEDASNVDKNYHGIATVSADSGVVEKINLDGNMTAKEMAKEMRGDNHIKLGLFSNIVAYRNSDNSVTITYISCSFTTVINK